MALKDIFGKKKIPATPEATQDEAKASKVVKNKTEKSETKTTKAEKPAKKTSTKAKKEEVTTETSTPAVKAKKETPDAKAMEGQGSVYRYRITEKATRLADKNVYVLNVPKTTNKIALKKDLETKYKVTVLAINIVNSPKKNFKKNTRNGGLQVGSKGGGKKAYITLKAGDSIVL